MLTDTDEANRHASHMLHRQQRTAARVTIKLRHHDAVEFQCFMESTRTSNRVLSRHTVDHKEHMVRAHVAVDRFQLLHQLFVDCQSAGGVQNYNLTAVSFRFRNGIAANFNRIFVFAIRVNFDADLFTDHVQLIDRRRTLQVSRDKHRFDFLPRQQFGKLSTGRRFTSTLQATHHDDVDVFAKVEPIFDGPQQVNQFPIDEPNELLRRLQREHDFLAERLSRNSAHELFDNVVADVGFEQRLFDHFQAFAHVAFGQLSLTAQGFEGTFEIVL